MKRSTTIPLALLFALLFAIPSLGAEAVENPAADQDRNESYFGLNGSKAFHIPEQTDTLVTERLSWMQDLGVYWDRVDLWWHVTETEPGVFDFSRSDRVFDVMESRCVQWYPILCYGSSQWKGHNAPTQSEHFDQFAEYVFQTVGHFKDHATYWSLWNEPNIAPFWNPEPRAEDYAKLLKLSYVAAKRANPDVKLCAPVTAPLAGLDRKFIEALYQQGIKDSFDIFDYHYYRNTPPEKDVPKELATIRAIMKRYGDDKPIWISETGVSSAVGPEDEALLRQASLIVRNQLLCLVSGVKRIFYFDLQNWHDVPEAEWDSKLGLVKADGTPKPSYFAYRTLVKEVDHQDFIGHSDGLGEGVQSVLLHDPRHDEYFLAVWMEDGYTTRKLELVCEPVDIRIVHPFGDIETRPMTPPRFPGQTTRTLTLPVDSHPRYIHNVDPMTYLPRAAVDLNPAMTILAPGEEAPLQVRIHPLLDTATVAVQSVDIPDGLTWDSKKGILRCPGNLPSGELDVQATLDVTFGPSDNRRFIQLERTATVEIVPTLSLSLRPYLDAEKLMVECSLSNRSSRVLEETPVLEEHRDGTTRVLQKADVLRLEGGQSTVVPFEIDPEILKEYRSTTTWSFAFGTFKSKPFHIQPIPFSQKAPTIDGDLSEWSTVPVLSIETESNVSRDSGGWTPDDASIRGRYQFSSDTMYFAAEIKDDDPIVNPHPPVQMWRGDSIELYLGLQGPTRRTVINKAFEYQLGLTPCSEKGNNPIAFWFHEDVEIDDAKVEVRKTETGWIVEAAIPLRLIKATDLPLKPYQLLGIDFALDDLDSDDWAPAGNDPGRALVWNGTPMNWIDPSGWGLGLLIPVETLSAP